MKFGDVIAILICVCMNIEENIKNYFKNTALSLNKLPLSSARYSVYQIFKNVNKPYYVPTDSPSAPTPSGKFSWWRNGSRLCAPVVFPI